MKSGVSNESRVTFQHWYKLEELSMPNSRIFRTYCSVCQLEAEMEVIGVDEEIDLIWVRCPGCNGILPYDNKGTTSDH